MIEAPSMPYFFLSYARSDPLAGNPDEDPDTFVGEFFSDLMAAVKDQASVKAGTAHGFFDRGIPVKSDWKKSVTNALSAAQVFVPLYSVGYLTNSWPGRELTCFKHRVAQTGWRDPDRRVLPVLWAPLAGVQDPPGLREALAPGVADPDYADNGLRALLRLRHHDTYEETVRRLARQVVQLAEHDPIDPIEPSEVGDIEEAKSEFPARGPLPVFIIEVAAPTAIDTAMTRRYRVYGKTAAEWRPFPGQESSLAEYARRLTRQFDFDAQVRDVTVADDPATRRPGIIVIDPAYIAQGFGRAKLKAVVRKLPRWVLPLVVVAPDDAATKKLAAGVFDILDKAMTLPAESARRAARSVKTLDDFVSAVPRLVAEAERQYLRYRTSRVLQSQERRASLRGLERPDEPTGVPDS